MPATKVSTHQNYWKIIRNWTSQPVSRMFLNCNSLLKLQKSQITVKSSWRFQESNQLVYLRHGINENDIKNTFKISTNWPGFCFFGRLEISNLRLLIWKSFWAVQNFPYFTLWCIRLGAYHENKLCEYHPESTSLQRVT